MSETRYIISDAAKMIDVEPHVLRYWEEELGMDIPRNEMGHRYYTDREVRIFTQVRDLKEKGFQLKAIKMILSAVSDDMPSDNIISLDKVRKDYSDGGKDLEEDQTEADLLPADKPCGELPEDAAPGEDFAAEAVSAEDKMKHFKYIMDGIMMQALKKNNQVLEDQVTGRVIKEMDYLFRIQEERDEERFRNLDDAIRKKQKGRKEAAAARIPARTSPGRRRGLFHKKDPF